MIEAIMCQEMKTDVCCTVCFLLISYTLPLDNPLGAGGTRDHTHPPPTGFL